MFAWGMVCGIVLVLLVLLVAVIFVLPSDSEGDEYYKTLYPHEHEKVLLVDEMILEGLPKRVSILEAHNDLTQQGNPVSWREVAARRASL